ncbi:MAG: XdhC family protein [Rhodospirillaceae bacterium]|jgi:xanthine dehydrogenase accessory factor|nr:XdhC family protein [Rhodospirillaceae bacterium]MBT5456065.1 XdhC family protein [Rhodospirillaceae bacterium]
MKAETLTQLLKDQEAKTAVALATDISSGDQALIYLDSAAGALADKPEIVDAGRDAMRDDKSGLRATPHGDIFFHVFNPPLRMVLVGAVHIAQPLSRLAQVAGYDVAVVDPRQSFATQERFPGVTIVDEWPDDGLNKLDLDRRTAVVTLTHDPKLDDPALGVAIRSPAFYIGSLGSRKTHAGRVERLTAEGFSSAEIDRIHGPVGLRIGAVSPAEIAVSILAEVTGILHAREQKAAA